MNPPTWLDERCRPPRQAPVSELRARYPGAFTPAELLKWYGWQLWSTVEWCGHRIEGIPVPDTDGRWRLIVVEGEAN